MATLETEPFTPTKGWERDRMSDFAQGVYDRKYAWKDDNGVVTETWKDTAFRVVSNVMGALGYRPGDWEFDRMLQLVEERKFLPGGRYLYASGRGLHQTQNCVLLRAEDSREGWADLMHRAGMALMTGAGIGVDYSDVRAEGEPIKKTGGTASGPISLMGIINEIGRRVMQGGSRRSAIWAGLSWKHPDVFKFIRAKDWAPEIRALKEKDFNFPATLDMTNVSVILDDEFFVAYHDPMHNMHDRAQEVYWMTVRKMITTAEPGFSIDTGINAGETLRNACTEVTSADDSDICNLGSINLARIEDIEEMKEAVELGTLFLLCGTVYSHVPYDKVADVRVQNRRLGLGLMGTHEWLLARGKAYAPDQELAEWLEHYQGSTEIAHAWADQHKLSRPIKTRSIAPTGTIGIVAETTTGIEPVFCSAFKRRYLHGNDWKFEYVIDPTVHRLVTEGKVQPHEVEDAYTLSYDVERRVAFQSWMQQYVDHAISSTINLPYPIEDKLEQREFGDMLMKYLPDLRGITAYPDGARGGQPLSVVPYDVAMRHSGVVFEESEERCVQGVCGA